MTVQLENRPGTLAEAARILAKENVNIEAVENETCGDFGFARFFTDNPDKAEKALRKKGYFVTTTELVEAILPNRPGELARVCEALAKAGVNIDGCIGGATGTGNGRVTFRVNDPVTARRVIQEAVGKVATISR